MDTSQLNGLWATRPVRPSANRTLAGVCAGFGARYRVDPTLVKVAFVVSTLFGGSGVLLYIAAWIMLPSERRALTSAPAAPHPGQRHPSGHRGRHGNPQFILLVVLGIVILTSIGNSTWSSSGLVGVVLMLLGWWLLYRRMPDAPVGTSVDTVTAGFGGPYPPVGDPGFGYGDGFQRWTPRSIYDQSGTATAVGPVSVTKTTTDDGPTPTPRHDADAAASPVSLDKEAVDADVDTDPVDTSTDPATQEANAPWTPRAVTAPLRAPDELPPVRRDVDAAFDDGGRPPSWDPLSTARFAWDLPDLAAPAPAAPVAPPADRRSPLTLIVLGVAVIVAAAGVAANQAGVEWFTPVRILSLALAIVGVGLVHAAFRRRTTGRHSTGLVPVAVLLAIAVVLTGLIGGVGELPKGGTGERVFTPAAESEIVGDYSLTAGSLRMDLSKVTLTADRHVTLRNGVGEIRVQIPADMNVRAVCRTQIGSDKCPSGLSGGRDGAAGPVLTIDAQTKVGQVEVTRGE